MATIQTQSENKAIQEAKELLYSARGLYKRYAHTFTKENEAMNRQLTVLAKGIVEAEKAFAQTEKDAIDEVDALILSSIHKGQ